MEHTPNADFCREELMERFPEEFQRALDDRLLRNIGPDYSSYSYGLSTPHTVTKTKIGWLAINPEDAEADPIPLTIEQLTRYKLDLDTLSRRFQDIHGLTGKPHALNTRLFFMGEGKKEDKTIACVLVLVNEALAIKSVVSELPSLLPRVYQDIIAVYPSRIPDQTEQRRLEGIGIRSTLLKNDLSVHPSIETLAKGFLAFAFKITETTLIWRGKTFPLTREQWAVLDIFDNARKVGQIYLSWGQIAKRLESYHFHPSRMRDVIRDAPFQTIEDKLILQTGNRYYLNI